MRKTQTLGNQTAQLLSDELNKEEIKRFLKQKIKIKLQGIRTYVTKQQWC